MDIGPRDGSDESSESAIYFAFTAFYYGSVEVSYILHSFLANVNVSLYAIARPSVVCLSSVTLVRPTQAVQIFHNISAAFGTLAIH